MYSLVDVLQMSSGIFFTVDVTVMLLVWRELADCLRDGTECVVSLPLRVPVVTFTSVQHILDSFLSCEAFFFHAELEACLISALRSCGSGPFALAAAAEMTLLVVCMEVKQGWIY